MGFIMLVERRFIPQEPPKPQLSVLLTLEVGQSRQRTIIGLLPGQNPPAGMAIQFPQDGSGLASDSCGLTFVFS